MTTTTTRKKLTSGQVADRYGVTRETVRRWADSGDLPCVKTLGGSRRFDPEELDRIDAERR